MKAIHWIALLLLPAAAWGAQAVQQSAPAVIQTSKEEVLLDVIFRDKKGKPIRDLESSDFQVTDGGAPQKITAFRLVEGISAESAPGNRTTTSKDSALDPARQVHLVTLVFERLGQDGRNLARQAGLDLLKSASGPNLYFGVFATDQRLAVLQQYTADRAALKKAIEKATGGAYSQFHDESQAIETNLRTVETSNSPVEVQFAQMTLNILQFAQSAERSQQGRASIFSLLSIVKEQMRLPGRKTVLYFSEGLQVPFNLADQFHSLIGVANRANVSVYAIDARGLLTTRDTTSGNLILADAARQTRNQTTAMSGGTTPEQAKALDRANDSLRANAQNALAELALNLPVNATLELPLLPTQDS